jgi:2-methylcitrate dehydratase PrpD
MAGDATEVLARFAATLKYDDIPQRVREYCKNVLLDALACALAGHRGEETRQVAALASTLEELGSARELMDMLRADDDRRPRATAAA